MPELFMPLQWDGGPEGGAWHDHFGMILDLLWWIR